MTRYDEEFARRFAERKKRQLNHGPCAAQVVDCDCDGCIRNDIRQEMLSWTPETGIEVANPNNG